jgi:hypothetical protein
MKTLDFMMGMTVTEITILGYFEQRFDVWISKAREVNNNLVLDMEWTEFKSHSSDESYFKL